MYIDLFFLLNLAVDYWLLLVMSKLLFREPGILRLMAGATIGAGAAVLVACWPNFWLHLTAVLAVPAGMLLLVFRPLHWRVAVISWLVFFLVSFLTGGAALALQGLCMPAGGTDQRVLVVILISACVILYLVPSRARSFLEEKKWQQRLKLKLLVRWQDKQKVISVLLDTGNRLKDPVRQRPVIIVDFQSVAELLPPEVNRRLEDPRVESWEVMQELQEHPLARFFILIPFQSLGVGEQLMLGFCPQEVTVFSGYQHWSLGSKAVLGLHRRGFGATAEYQALLPPELIGQVGGGSVGSTFNQA